jgi:cytochrome P450
MSHVYNPLIPPQRDNPFPYYQWARAEQPVSYVPAMGAWMVTRYDDIRTVIRDPVRFSSRRAVPRPDEMCPPEVVDILAEGPAYGRMVLTEDPPDHEALRRVSTRLFSGRRIDALSPRIRETVDDLIDAFAGDGRAELVDQFNDQLANRVICMALGVPSSDTARVRAWSDSLVLLVNPFAAKEEQRAAAHEFVAYQHYIVDLIEARRREPQDDLISDVVRIDDLPGTPLPLEDLVVFVWSNHIAGLNTTRDTIGSALLSMLSDRQHWTRARVDPDIIPELFEETLRRDAPHRGLFRHTTQQVELGGVTLPAGTALYLLFGSANRDGTRFEAPDEFRPGRDDVRAHLAFGDGIHKCVGAYLARTEGRMALTGLVKRLPTLRFAPDFRPTYRADAFFRGLQRLDVIWDASRRSGDGW